MPLQRIDTLPSLPIRPADSHKGTFGRVLIVAGSPGMSGAAALSGLGALRGGAGLVYVATHRSVVPIVASIEPSYLLLPLSEEPDGQLAETALMETWAAVDGKNAVAIGPGLGKGKQTSKIVWSLFEDAEVPLVVDADGLNLLAEDPDRIGKAPAPRILTPHPGEFARLTGTDIVHVQSHREERAVEFAARHHVILVLKGKGTIITDGTRIAINSTGNSGMATGGTGDVLTGLVTALLAQKMEPFEAAQLAVFLHGRAGDLAAADLSEPSMIASDLARYLGKAWLSISLHRRQITNVK